MIIYNEIFDFLFGIMFHHTLLTSSTKCKYKSVTQIEVLKFFDKEYTVHIGPTLLNIRRVSVLPVFSDNSELISRIVFKSISLRHKMRKKNLTCILRIDEVVRYIQTVTNHIMLTNTQHEEIPWRRIPPNQVKRNSIFKKLPNQGANPKNTSPNASPVVIDGHQH